MMVHLHADSIVNGFLHDSIQTPGNLRIHLQMFSEPLEAECNIEIFAFQSARFCRAATAINRFKPRLGQAEPNSRWLIRVAYQRRSTLSLGSVRQRFGYKTVAPALWL